MAQLSEISKNLAINKSRAISLSINLLHNLMEKSFPEKEMAPKTYVDVVLSPKMLTAEAPEEVKVEAELQPEAGRKRRGWPKGRPRKPVLRVLMGRAHEQSN